MHPAIQGMMDRVGEKTGPFSPRGRITDDDRLSFYQRILDVPTLDYAERTEGTGGYHMMGRADNNPDITSFARRGSMDDPSAYTRRAEDFARYNLDEKDKERLADTLNLKDMSGTLEFIPRNRQFGEDMSGTLDFMPPPRRRPILGKPIIPVERPNYDELDDEYMDVL